VTTPTIVTLQQVQNHLRIPIDLEDVDLSLKLQAATQLVCAHISDRQPADPDWIAEIEAWNVEEGSPANPAPPIVVLAVLELCADFTRFRGDDGDGDRLREPGFLPPAIRNLLVRYRDPALA
jgi:hypothetical protein